ncbi:unnamed protein product [Hyaloperonospora brassicae]|uniref:Uncharacterized protein n=1 Tax=Hyaloperonospora brassicae TaxID=162125 RepID=A0AAV0T0J1_HYABA|nr:unnamed protein product [Hyaloperonospora brassicae]
MAAQSWQEALASETDAAKKEWMALERRYHLQRVDEDASKTGGKCVRLFLSLSAPELPTRLKGQVDLQLTMPANYPMDAVQVDFSQWSSRLSGDQVDALNAAVYARAQQLRGGFSMRKLLTWMDNNFWPVIAPYEKNSDGLQDVVIAEAGDSSRELEPMVAEATEIAPSEKKAKGRRGSRACRFFARGKCREGEACRFSHKKQQKHVDKGADAAENLSHDQDASQALPNEVPKQESEQAKPTRRARVRRCRYFAQNGCRDGESCKFVHETKGAETVHSGRTQKLKSLPRACVVALDEDATVAEEMHIDEAVENNSIDRNKQNVEDCIESSSAWSEAQQRALDLALKKYPAVMDKKERWVSIANEVDGRSLNECIDRFKALCELVRRGVDPVAIAEKVDTSEENTVESSEDEKNARNSRIVPADKRVLISTAPQARGTRICLEDLFLHEVGTLVAHELVCQIQCGNCPLKFDAVLRLDAAEIQKWCPRCSALHHVLMRPVFAHSLSNLLAYVDTENCYIVDVLPSDVLATCLECGCEALLSRIRPRQRSEQACFSCHVKLAVMTKRFVAAQIEETSVKRSNDVTVTIAKGKKGARQIAEAFVLGQPLPRNGTCDHYKHSLRWFRFQCCGKAFPCDVCHDSSDCPEANLGKFASRMICGLCSKEQSSSVKVCSCGNDVASKKSTSCHWEGGAGCRDVLKMSRWDRQKYRGQNKTESRKLNRVGAEAKRRREENV